MFGNLTTLSHGVKRGLLAATLLAGALAPVVPNVANAASDRIYFNPASSPATITPTNHAPGDVFTMPVFGNAGTATTGWQFSLKWDPAQLDVTAVDARITSDGTTAGAVVPTGDSFLGNYVAANSAALSTGSLYVNGGALNHAAGTLNGVAGAILGAGSLPGPTGVGQLATLTVKVLSTATNNTSPTLCLIPQAAGNATACASATPNNTSGAFLHSGLAPDFTNGTVYIGAIPSPTLAIEAANTSGSGTAFNVTYNVHNTGNGSSTATTSAVNVTNATPAGPVSVAVPALAAGATATGLTAGPFTLSAGQTLSNVTISVSCGSNNPCTAGPNATTAYSYAAYTSTGTTTITASNPAVLVLTAPADITGFALVAGQNNQTAAEPLIVKSNLSSFNVTISGDNNGHLSEFNSGAYIAGGKQLGAQLQAKASAVPASGNTGQPSFQSITGSPVLFVAGTLPGQDANAGATFNTTFQQYVGFNDPSVVAPHVYHEVVTFTASGTF